MGSACEVLLPKCQPPHLFPRAYLENVQPRKAIWEEKGIFQVQNAGICASGYSRKKNVIFSRKKRKEPNMRERPWEEHNFVFANRPFWRIRS